VWLVLRGRGVLRMREELHRVEGETIARAPLGWPCDIEVAEGDSLHALRVRKQLTANDKSELKALAANNAAPHVKKFADCPAYGEAIKSAKTVSRTLLPENYVPRVAIGTVETLGPDQVAAHRHPMLEQLFLGLEGNDVTVVADEARVPFTAFSLLHIPLGSNHGVEAGDGKKLRYVWMDFFLTLEGQEWLKMHKAIPAPSDQP